MKKYRVFIILLIITIIYLTVNISSAFVINKPGHTITAYKNNNLVRLHVIANSNSPQDQYIKRQIRDKVVNKMSALKSSPQINQEMVGQIEKHVKEILQQSNVSYSARVYMGDYNFPMRSYGELTLPEGKYKAVRIILGTGKGSNWWCVLLPPLCITGNKDNTDKYNNVISGKTNIEFKFKITEILNNNKYNFVELESKPVFEIEKMIDLPGRYIY